jgi:hypothetical protein
MGRSGDVRQSTARIRPYPGSGVPARPRSAQPARRRSAAGQNHHWGRCESPFPGGVFPRSIAPAYSWCAVACGTFPAAPPRHRVFKAGFQARHRLCCRLGKPSPNSVNRPYTYFGHIRRMEDKRAAGRNVGAVPGLAMRVIVTLLIVALTITIGRNFGFDTFSHRRSHRFGTGRGKG